MLDLFALTGGFDRIDFVHGDCPAPAWKGYDRDKYSANGDVVRVLSNEISGLGAPVPEEPLWGKGPFQLNLCALIALESSRQLDSQTQP